MIRRRKRRIGKKSRKSNSGKIILIISIMSLSTRWLSRCKMIK